MATTPLMGVIDNNLSILILNTEPSCSVVIGIILHLCGYGVRRATTAAQAMEFLETNTPDVILTDRVDTHPEWDDIIHHLRSNPNRKRIPMVGVTHQPDPTLEDVDPAVGVDAMVSVPFTPEQFQDVLSPLLCNQIA